MILLRLFIMFFKIGLVSFGGGYAMIPVVEAELNCMGWLSSHEFCNLIAVSEVTPGSVSVNTATFVGYRVAGILGGLFATLGIVMPSLLVVLLTSMLLLKYGNTRSIRTAFMWVKPAVAGLIIVAGVYVAQTCLIDDTALHPLHFAQLFNLKGILVFAVTAYLLKSKKLSIMPLFGLSSLMGILLFYKP